MTLRVAVWGLGPHAVRNVLPAVAQARGMALHGVYSRNPEVVSAACAQYGCARWESAQAMLADAEVDAVYLSTPISLHAAQGQEVLRAGKHFWCEKPIATRVDEAEALCTLSRGRGVTVAEGFMYLYHPHFARLREMVAGGGIGRVVSVVCRFGIPPLDRPSFRNDPALGGGAFLDVGSYPLSAVVGLFPDVDPEVTLAEIDTAPGSAVDTAGSALLRYPGGARAYLEWKTGVGYRNEIDVWGDAGSVSTERIFSKAADYVPRFRVLDRTGRETVEEGRAGNHFVTMLETFRGLVDDTAAAERERQLIARRARLVGHVRDRSTP
ncbi:MAG TPA: Gfo/Idh/MocA family oxidoreductase [Longimicrobium sp.]|nr:Gfo/Idh/MocA family oxidoreductase [Longimicrobium sp.]